MAVHFRLSLLLPISKLFPVRQGSQFVKNALQSFEPPLLRVSLGVVAFSGLARLDKLPVLFTNNRYFVPQLPNAFLHGFLHDLRLYLAGLVSSRVSRLLVIIPSNVSERRRNCRFLVAVRPGTIQINEIGSATCWHATRFSGKKPYKGPGGLVRTRVAHATF